MRSTLTLFLATVAAAPLAAQASATQDVAAAFQPEPYLSIRPGELQSAAFLTEMRTMPYGRVLGPIQLAAVPARQSPAMAVPGETIGVLPPTGVSYQRGDTIVLAMVKPGLNGWGDMVVPTGLARVGASTPRQTEAVVIAMYYPIREGQVTLPLAPAPRVGDAQPVPASGPTGSYIGAREPGVLHPLGDELFIDMGKAAGIRLGDFIEFRRRAGARPNAADTIDERLAEGQVVSVGEKGSTVRLFRVSDPAIPVGSPVLRIATLPN